ncbi:MAG: UbiA family prenyltransferase [Candidatus Methanoperedens sp.]
MKLVLPGEINYLNIIDVLQKFLKIGEKIFKKILQSLNRFISLLAISSIIIAITGFLLPFFSFLLYGINIDFGLLFASFLITFAVYSLNKLTDIKEDSINNANRARFTEKNSHLIILAVVASTIIAIYLSYIKSIFAIFVILFPFCVGFIYSIKIANFRLKDIIGIKSLSVALSWAFIGTFIPVAVQSSNILLVSLIFYFFF